MTSYRLKTHFTLVNRITSLILLLTASFAGLDVAAQSNSPQKRLEQVAALIRDNRIVEAEQQLASILKFTPRAAAALNLLGTIRARQGRLNEAEAVFLRAVRIDNQLVGAHLNLADLYMLKGASEKSISELKEVLRLDPTNAEATYKIARLLLSQSRVDECVNFFEKLKQSQSPAAAVLVVLGDAYLAKDDAEKSEENYLLAFNQQSDNADAILGLARIAQKKGDNKTAALYLFRARELVGNSPDLLYKFALVAVRLELFEEAKSTLEQAVKLKPDEPAYLLALGATWIKRPDLQAAEQAFRRALQLQPDSAQAQMYLGYVLFKQKKYPEARVFLERTIKADASTPEPFYYLALTAQQLGEEGRALQILERLVQRFPAFALAHIALGSTYLKLKNYQRAQQELELAVKLSPDEPTAHYQLALLYARLKDQQRAQEEMRILEKLKNEGKVMEEGNDVPAPAKPGPG